MEGKNLPARFALKSLAVYYCGYQKCEKGYGFGPAVRNQYLLHFVVSGKGSYTVGGKVYPVKGGEAFLIRPGQLTYYCADTRDPWVYMWIGFGGIDAKEILARTPFRESCVAAIPQPGEFQECLSEIIREARETGGKEYRILGSFYRAMAQLETAETAGSYEEEYFRKASEYMQNNYSYPIKIADLAAFVGVDRTYLYKIFRNRQGVSPKQYLLQTRIEAAGRMLETKAYTVGEVALSCGFGDASSFCKHFRRITGKTPRQFSAQGSAREKLSDGSPEAAPEVSPREES